MASQSVSEPLDPRVPYDYTYFWRNPPEGALGPWQEADPSASPAHLQQEADLLKALEHFRPNHRSIGPIRSIFEVGCGRGRLTRFFAANFPEATYEAIDLSADAIHAASAYRPDGLFSVADIVTYDAHARYDEPEFDGFDLVIASEVLMHLPYELLDRTVQNLLTLTNADRGRLVTIDWVPMPNDLYNLRRKRGGIAPWNFPHNYKRLFSTFGSVIRQVRTSQQVIHVVRP